MYYVHTYTGRHCLTSTTNTLSDAIRIADSTKVNTIPSYTEVTDGPAGSDCHCYYFVTANRAVEEAWQRRQWLDDAWTPWQDCTEQEMQETLRRTDRWQVRNLPDGEQ